MHLVFRLAQAHCAYSETPSVHRRRYRLQRPLPGRRLIAAYCREFVGRRRGDSQRNQLPIPLGPSLLPLGPSLRMPNWFVRPPPCRRPRPVGRSREAPRSDRQEQLHRVHLPVRKVHKAPHRQRRSVLTCRTVGIANCASASAPCDATNALSTPKIPHPASSQTKCKENSLRKHSFNQQCVVFATLRRSSLFADSTI